MDTIKVKNELKETCSSVDQATTLRLYYKIVIEIVLLVRKAGLEQAVLDKDDEYRKFIEIYENNKASVGEEMNFMPSGKYRRSNIELDRIFREPERKKNIVRIKKTYSSAVNVVNEIKNQR